MARKTTGRGKGAAAADDTAQSGSESPRTGAAGKATTSSESSKAAPKTTAAARKTTGKAGTAGKDSAPQTPDAASPATASAAPKGGRGAPATGSAPPKGQISPPAAKPAVAATASPATARSADETTGAPSKAAPAAPIAGKDAQTPDSKGKPAALTGTAQDSARDKPDAPAPKPAAATNAATTTSKPASDDTAAAPAKPDRPAGSNKDTAPPSAEATARPEPPSTQDAPSRAGSPVAPPPATADPAPRSPFIPLLLGGVLAGGLGFGAHYLISEPPADSVEIAALQSELAALRADMEQAISEQPAFDPAPLQAQIDDLRSDMLQQLAELAGQVPDAAPGAEVIADLDALAHGLEAVQQQMAALEQDGESRATAMAALQAEMADLRDLATRRVAEAEAAVDQALAMAALDSLRAALTTGAAFSDPVAQLARSGVEVPDLLAGRAESGIPTEDQLLAGFAAASRAALRQSLTQAPAESTVDRLTNFLRAQTGARSIVARDGDDPDAILSRAGAALERGALSDALGELDDLPEDARAAMSDWLGGAQARAQAADAVAALARTITKE
ncbi:MAG: hypothetical protein JJT99_00705 [Rhodobacteraceae bacterium]|nr:hypothetical protein [Paracoccaceae bacterium]